MKKYLAALAAAVVALTLAGPAAAKPAPKGAVQAADRMAQAFVQNRNRDICRLYAPSIYEANGMLTAGGKPDLAACIRYFNSVDDQGYVPPKSARRTRAEAIGGGVVEVVYRVVASDGSKIEMKVYLQKERGRWYVVYIT